MTARKKVYSDPDFAAEMAALQHSRDEARAAEMAEFKRDWEQRLERGIKPVHESPMHQHVEACWSEPYEVVEHGVRLVVQRCATSNTRREVPRP